MKILKFSGMKLVEHDFDWYDEERSYCRKVTFTGMEYEDWIGDKRKVTGKGVFTVTAFWYRGDDRDHGYTATLEINGRVWQIPFESMGMLFEQAQELVNNWNVRDVASALKRPYKEVKEIYDGTKEEFGDLDVDDNYLKFKEYVEYAVPFAEEAMKALKSGTEFC